MAIGWITAFIDLPAPRFDPGTNFWRAVTTSTLSPPRGDQDQFATLIPPEGDPYLRVQRLGSEPRIHLDLHATDVADTRHQATALGATVVMEPGHVVMRSPAGITFCVVAHHGERHRPPPGGPGRPHTLDQVCLDLAPDLFDTEVGFWSGLTGWEAHPGGLDEFWALTRPPPIPLRLLFQRLEPGDRGPARAHLDLACGHDREPIVAAHQALGAELVAVHRYWTVLRDPAGLPYCLTGRHPETGAFSP